MLEIFEFANCYSNSYLFVYLFADSVVHLCFFSRDKRNRYKFQRWRNRVTEICYFFKFFFFVLFCKSLWIIIFFILFLFYLLLYSFFPFFFFFFLLLFSFVLRQILLKKIFWDLFINLFDCFEESNTNFVVFGLPKDYI